MSVTRRTVAQFELMTVQTLLRTNCCLPSTGSNRLVGTTDASDGPDDEG
jgi:hypothetical protein